MSATKFVDYVNRIELTVSELGAAARISAGMSFAFLTSSAGEGAERSKIDAYADIPSSCRPELPPYEPRAQMFAYRVTADLKN